MEAEVRICPFLGRSATYKQQESELLKVSHQA
jgi:hypothetical protein